eukprot:CFRG6832T1
MRTDSGVKGNKTDATQMCLNNPRSKISIYQPPLRIYRDDVVTFKKCRFQAFVCRGLREESEIAHVLEHVVSEKKVAKASHPHIHAYVCKSGDSGFNCDGESGAGRLLLDLLIARGETDTLVSITRWYGGAPLGGARFRVITKAARDALDASQNMD